MAFLSHQGAVFGLVERHAQAGDPDRLCGGHLYWTLPEALQGWGSVLHQLAAGGPSDVEHLTITPSLLCRRCGDHGFITDGKWIAV